MYPAMSERNFIPSSTALASLALVTVGMVLSVQRLIDGVALLLKVVKDHGWSARRLIPHGGHQFALHAAAGLGLHGNESYPGVFQPFGGFADGCPVENGLVRLPDAPGIGVELKENLWEVFRDL